MSKLYERCLKWWNSYRYRFTPWIIYSWQSRKVRLVDQEVTDRRLSGDQVENSLIHLFRAFKCSNLMGKVTEHGNDESLVEAHIKSRSYYDVSNHRKESPVNMSSFFNDQYTKQSESHLSTEYVLHKTNLEILRTHYGFTVERKPSTIEGAGMGVFVTSGSIPPNTIAALYPGVVYNPGEPLLLQSLGNAFIFRCIDGIHIDGNDRSISKIIFKSSSHRDKIGLHFISDLSWLTPYPINPLAVGQYVNNGSTGNPANVTYQEFDFSEKFPVLLRQFIPNIHYSSEDGVPSDRTMRTVVLLSLRQIDIGEELFSSYYTVVVK